LAQAKSAFYASLNTTTVADLAQQPTRSLLIGLGALAAQIDPRTD
jgi:Rrf2 family nitric oxide-sensitive transcriptional repressor